jgi:hypothetical protein
MESRLSTRGYAVSGRAAARAPRRLDQPREHTTPGIGGRGARGIAGGAVGDPRLLRRAVGPGLLRCGVTAQELFHGGGPARGRGARAPDPQAAERPVHRGNRFLQRVGLVGDAELEEGAPLHDGLGAGGVVDPRELDHDAVVAHHLGDGLGDAELVHPLAEDGERQIQIPLGIGRHLLRLVQLQGQVHPALEIEAELERHPFLDPIGHHPRFEIALPERDVAGNQVEDAEGDEGQDDQQAVAN